MEYKICTKCGRTLEVTKNFYKKGKNSDEYRNYCKECGNNWQLKYYKENRDKRVAYQKKYETNKRNKNKKYIIEKVESIELEKEFKKYYEGVRKYKQVVSNKAVRNKDLPKDYKEYFKSKHQGKCYCEICGQWEDVEEMLQVHHILEISKYQENNKDYTTFDNVVMLCCNCHKLTHILGDLDKVKEYYNLKNNKVINN